MQERPIPVLRTIQDVHLVGTMVIYDSQAEASDGIPNQWRQFRINHPALGRNSEFRGASPCTGDHKIHYLAGIVQEGSDGLIGGEPLNLEAGEYAVVQVNDTVLLRDTWTWLLGSWLPNSGRRERKAPEFEKYAGISETGVPNRTSRNLDPSRTTCNRLSCSVLFGLRSERVTYDMQLRLGRVTGLCPTLCG